MTTILILLDDPRLRGLYRETLENAGYTVLAEAPWDRDRIDAIEDNIDLVITGRSTHEIAATFMLVFRIPGILAFVGPDQIEDALEDMPVNNMRVWFRHYPRQPSELLALVRDLITRPRRMVLTRRQRQDPAMLAATKFIHDHPELMEE